jgi:transcriptional regulator with XRE-family HTH domain
LRPTGFREKILEIFILAERDEMTAPVAGLPRGDAGKLAPKTGSLGGDLRALRRARGLTLTELATAIDRSVGWISQVERGLSEPSISDLRRFAALFGVPLGFFFSNEESAERERRNIVRHANRRTLGDRADGLLEELLSPDLGGSFEVFRSVFEPGKELKEAQLRQTEEAGYLVSGRLDLWIGDQLFHLEPGDSFRFDHEPFRWRNPGKEPAVVIWVIAPPVY